MEPQERDDSGDFDDMIDPEDVVHVIELGDDNGRVLNDVEYHV